MEKRGYGQKILNTTIDNNSVKRSEGVKDLEEKGFKEPRGRKGEGVKDSRIWKRKGSRSQGFEGSSGERQRAGRLEGWRVSEKLEKKGFKESRIRGVKWFPW